jgi:hypothetical protein
VTLRESNSPAGEATLPFAASESTKTEGGLAFLSPILILGIRMRGIGRHERAFFQSGHQAEVVHNVKKCCARCRIQPVSSYKLYIVYATVRNHYAAGLFDELAMAACVFKRLLPGSRNSVF